MQLTLSVNDKEQAWNKSIIVKKKSELKLKFFYVEFALVRNFLLYFYCLLDRNCTVTNFNFPHFNEKRVGKVLCYRSGRILRFPRARPQPPRGKTTTMGSSDTCYSRSGYDALPKIISYHTVYNKR